MCYFHAYLHTMPPRHHQWQTQIIPSWSQQHTPILYTIPLAPKQCHTLWLNKPSRSCSSTDTPVKEVSTLGNTTDSVTGSLRLWSASVSAISVSELSQSKWVILQSGSHQQMEQNQTFSQTIYAPSDLCLSAKTLLRDVSALVNADGDSATGSLRLQSGATGAVSALEIEQANSGQLIIHVIATQLSKSNSIQCYHEQWTFIFLHIFWNIVVGIFHTC